MDYEDARHNAIQVGVEGFSSVIAALEKEEVLDAHQAAADALDRYGELLYASGVGFRDVIGALHGVAISVLFSHTATEGD